MPCRFFGRQLIYSGLKFFLAGARFLSIERVYAARTTTAQLGTQRVSADARQTTRTGGTHSSHALKLKGKTFETLGSYIYLIPARLYLDLKK